MLPDKYKNQKKETDSNGRVMLPEGYLSYNQELQRIAIQKETDAIEEYKSSLTPYDPNELPSLPLEGEALNQGLNRDTKIEEIIKDVKLRTSPLTNPVLEVMNAINSGIIGSAWDLAVAIQKL